MALPLLWHMFLAPVDAWCLTQPVESEGDVSMQIYGADVPTCAFVCLLQNERERVARGGRGFEAHPAAADLQGRRKRGGVENHAVKHVSGSSCARLDVDDAVAGWPHLQPSTCRHWLSATSDCGRLLSCG